MRKLSYLFICYMLLGCTESISEENLPKLNGYWEIAKVVFPDGNIKDYSMNPVVDYVQLEGYLGYRKKVQPKFDGTYDTSNDAEPFSIVEIKGIFYMIYDNAQDKWREQLLALDDDSFSVVNEDGIQYDYKRFEPISAEKNE